jgi:hypothetical protein
MKPWRKQSFDEYDDSEDSDSGLESMFEYPKLLVDIDGKKKFILNHGEEMELLGRLKVAQEQTDMFQAYLEKENLEVKLKASVDNTDGHQDRGASFMKDLATEKGRTFSGRYQAYLDEENSIPDKRFPVKRNLCIFGGRYRAFLELEDSKRTVKKKSQTNGLAPFRMGVPLEGKACMVRGGHTKKVPLKESNQEMYNRIQKEKELKGKKKDKRIIKKLKKDGKVGTLAPFMFDN